MNMDSDFVTLNIDFDAINESQILISPSSNEVIINFGPHLLIIYHPEMMDKVTKFGPFILNDGVYRVTQLESPFSNRMIWEAFPIKIDPKPLPQLMIMPPVIWINFNP